MFPTFPINDIFRPRKGQSSISQITLRATKEVTFTLVGKVTAVVGLQQKFGMKLYGEMLSPFTAELGNMIGGSLSRVVRCKWNKNGYYSPTIMKGDTTLSDHEKAFQISVHFEIGGEIQIYILLDI